jgi:hypothetical protein
LEKKFIALEIAKKIILRSNFLDFLGVLACNFKIPYLSKYLVFFHQILNVYSQKYTSLSGYAEKFFWLHNPKGHMFLNFNLRLKMLIVEFQGCQNWWKVSLVHWLQHPKRIFNYLEQIIFYSSFSGPLWKSNLL